MEVSVQLHTLDSLPSGKDSLMPTGQEAGYKCCEDKNLLSLFRIKP